MSCSFKNAFFEGWLSLLQSKIVLGYICAQIRGDASTCKAYTTTAYINTRHACFTWISKCQQSILMGMTRYVVLARTHLNCCGVYIRSSNGVILTTTLIWGTWKWSNMPPPPRRMTIAHFTNSLCCTCNGSRPTGPSRWCSPRYGLSCVWW